MKEFYRISIPGIQKRGLRPFLLSQTGFWPDQTIYAATFFLPITLLIIGQKSNSNARDVMPPTK